MNIYSKDSTAQLLEILEILAADKIALVQDGFEEIANQNQQVIDAITAEIESRKVAA
jgi:hypothetical protein